MTLLIVDDEPIIAEGLIASLDWENHKIDTILTAGSMQEAIPLLLRYHIDIAMCDIEMPGGSGLDLIKWMNENSPHTVTVILSSHGEFTYAQQAVRMNCMEYLLKPAEQEELAQVTDRAVSLVLKRAHEEGLRIFGQNWAKSVAGKVPEDDVELAQSFIRSHLSEDLSLEQIAGQIHMSPDYMTKKFKKSCGMTVMEYVIWCRIQLACELLQQTSLPINDVADRVGIPNYTYFTRLFKRCTNMTPSEYRRQNSQ